MGANLFGGIASRLSDSCTDHFYLFVANLQLKKGLVYYGTHFEVLILLELLNQDSRIKSPSCCICENYVKWVSIMKWENVCKFIMGNRGIWASIDVVVDVVCQFGYRWKHVEWLKALHRVRITPFLLLRIAFSVPTLALTHELSKAKLSSLMEATEGLFMLHNVCGYFWRLCFIILFNSKAEVHA